MPTLKEILDSRFGGVIKKGCHAEDDGEVCALELLSIKKGIGFGVSPAMLKCFDFRPLNDVDVSDELRTECMLPMLEAYDGSLDWEMAKQKKVIERIIVSTVNQLIVNLPGTSKTMFTERRMSKIVEEARVVANIVYSGAIVVSYSGSPSITAAARAICAAEYLCYDVNYPAVRAARAIAQSCNYAVIASREFVSDDASNAIFTKACKIWLEAAKD